MAPVHPRSIDFREGYRDVRLAPPEPAHTRSPSVDPAASRPLVGRGWSGDGRVAADCGAPDGDGRGHHGHRAGDADQDRPEDRVEPADHRAMTIQRRRRASEAGQTANEMLMIMGLLTAMIIATTNIVIPTMGF